MIGLGVCNSIAEHIQSRDLLTIKQKYQVSSFLHLIGGQGWSSSLELSRYRCIYS